METSNKTNILLAVLIVIGLAILYTSYSDHSEPVIERNNAIIDSLAHNMEARQNYRDSLLTARLKDLQQLKELKSQETHIIYEYHKDSIRIASMPIDGVYVQLASDIATDYR